METQASQEQPLVLQVIPPRTESSRDMAALETVMQGLALDERHPVALEIVRTGRGRLFLLRATSRAALEHIAAQIQARYPQAEIRSLAEDPLALKEGETVAVVELGPGAASYLPLRSWRERELPSEGTDPLLGVLAALSHLPEQMRVVAQLALLPLPPAWSKAERRRAVEHPLEPERQRQRRETTTSGSAAPSMAAILLMGLLVALLLLWYRFSRRLPAWVFHAGTLLLHGKNPQLTPSQLTLLVACMVGIVLLLLVALFLFNRLRQRFGRTAIYDMRLVAEKTGRSAYRARLRLFLITSEVSGQQALSVVRTEDSLTVAGAKDASPYRLAVLRHCGKLFPLSLWQTFSRLCGRQKGIVTRGQDEVRWEVLERLSAAYRQYHLAAGGYFVPRRLSAGKAQRLLVHGPGLLGCFSGWAHDLRTSRHVLSVADVAVLWHLPQAADLPALPLLERGRARNFLVPFELSAGSGWRIGLSTQAGHALPVYLPAAFLRNNLLAVARTGKGKSTLFQHLAQAVLSGGMDTRGLFLIEPHGDLIEALSGLLPGWRQDDVVLVDLADQDYPPGINLLDATLGRSRDKAVDNLIGIFRHIWDTSWGPRTESVLEYALKTLADANEHLVQADPQHGPDRQYTLLDIVSLLRNISFRHAVMQQVSDPVLLDWWQQYYEPMDLRFQLEIISSVINKMAKFASTYTARRILGQPRSTIDLRDIVRTGKILLVSTANGVVGSDVGALIGSTLLGLFQVNLAEQAELPREQRQPFLVLIDEFQIYRGADFGSMLAELRKYGGSFGLATQSLAYLDRLDRTLRYTVLANVDHLFAFAMSAEDARLLQELDGIESDDITNLDDYTCYAKLTVQGHRLPVFSLRLDASAAGDSEQAQRVRLRTRQRFARPVDVIDAMLAQSLKRQAAYPVRTKTGERTRERELLPGEQVEEEEGGQGGISPSQAGVTEKQATKTARRKRRGGGGGGGNGVEVTLPIQQRADSLPLLYEPGDLVEREQEGVHEA